MLVGLRSRRTKPAACGLTDQVGEFAGEAPRRRDRRQASVARCLLRRPAVQVLAVDQVLGEEDAPAGLEDLARSGSDAPRRETGEHIGLVAEPFPGIGLAGLCADVRACLLQQDVLAGVFVACAVDAAAVGVGDGFPDEVAPGDERRAASAPAPAGAYGLVEGSDRIAGPGSPSVVRCSSSASARNRRRRRGTR
ncbi:hypothetical protein [Streptomyces sp. XH2]|uniref:hypothetical protein n=1 Tax=Streptomyces sp. XH2 TaxID=3412483 RepID=UPI003C7E4772